MPIRHLLNPNLTEIIMSRKSLLLVATAVIVTSASAVIPAFASPNAANRSASTARFQGSSGPVAKPALQAATLRRTTSFVKPPTNTRLIGSTQTLSATTHIGPSRPNFANHKVLGQAQPK